ncbi:intermembrane lipid transfer protein VPS13B isoform X1 [Ictalurus punctatus]|uniref:Intermembrane lipid transfer protein VPS13B isoform X1 n=1 Tax=Ictalurus punctatus TaxID=7998 RepID=A0A2D0PT84_ICTPU|nr:intermembrane lipid transfer protein VPS13B isoform X1 [Ictalurus punctatus]XP_017308305.2 intermembrane lipid transfer protein VPS13B isoform X1 [Ictalurus punctatus]
MLESYVTPLLMSYVNRYIKNLKPSDLQLSLWGGDVVLSKLDLKLDVLEQELKLPFTFLSGHIHELRIHVPWTKLSSEPVVVTINTMECILKLKDGSQDENESSASSWSASEKSVPKPRRLQQSSPDPDLPPGYVQSLIRRVVNNLNVVINNLILKYVEDDIVLSVNITSAECYTVDEQWDRAFMDISSPKFVLKKVINFADCTVCLDKRNASGKIEFYQDPLLYKCSFRTRLHFTYHNINYKIPAIIKIHTIVESLKLSLTDQQLPMFVRLLELAVALYYGEIRAQRDGEREESTSTTDVVVNIPAEVVREGMDANASDQYSTQDQCIQNDNDDQGWVSWAWSFVPAIINTEEEEQCYPEMEDTGNPSPLQSSLREPIVSVGFYCTKASVTFKLTENSSESSYYSPQKVKSQEVLCVEQEGITVEALMMGELFFDCQIGVVGCRALCLKGFMGVWDFEKKTDRKEEDAVFFYCGEDLSSKGITYLTNSLFDSRSPENNGVRAEFILDANLHKETYTEAAGLQRFGAFYLDYLYTMENKSGKGQQDFPLMGKVDSGQSVQEMSIKRLMIGPLDLLLHSSAVHRILKMVACAMDHEYEPYYTLKPDVVEENKEVPLGNERGLEEFIPTRLTCVTVLKASITVSMAEFNLLHILLPAVLGQKGLAVQLTTTQFHPVRPLPAIRMQVERVNLEHSVPMYGIELIHTVSSLSMPSDNLLHHCYTHCCLKVFELQVGLTLLDNEGTPPLLPIIPCFSTALYGKILQFPTCWPKRSSVSITEYLFELPKFTMQATHGQMLLLHCLWQSWTHSTESGVGPTASDSLINEIYRTPGVKCAPTLEVSVQSVELKVCQKALLWCASGMLGAVTVCSRTHGMGERQKEQLVVVLQGPADTRELYSRHWLCENRRPQSLLAPDLLTFSLQIPQPTGDWHNSGAILLVGVQGIAVNLDPILSTWLLYHSQRPTTSRQTQQMQTFGSGSMLLIKTREDEASVASTPLAKQLSNQASDYISSPMKTKTITESRPLSIPLKITQSATEHAASSEEWIKNLISQAWNAVKRLTLQVELQSCCVFVPKDTLPCPYTIVCGDIPGTVRSWYHSQASMPGTLVICLPQVSMMSAGHRHMEPLQEIPFTVPRPVLEEGDAFPWTVTVGQFSVYTLLGHQRSLALLEPVGFTSTLAVTSHKLLPASTSLDSRHAFIICLHVDLQPLYLKVSNPQVQLLYELFLNWSRIWDCLQRRGILWHASGFQGETPPQPAGSTSPFHSSAGTIPPDNGSFSRSADLGSPTEGDSVPTGEDPSFCEPLTLEQKTSTIGGASGKVSLWMQWMLPKLTVKLFAPDPTTKTEICVLSELEDLSASVDMQDVYTKLKCKVSSFNIDHYRSSGKAGPMWPGVCSGVLLSCTDKLNRRTLLLRQAKHQDPFSHFSAFFPPMAAKALEACHQPHGFLSLTYTQAVTCNVLHKLTARHEKAGPQRLSSGGSDGSPQHLHEILLTAQPFDLVLSCPLLASITQVFHTLSPPPSRWMVKEFRSAGQPMGGRAFSSSSLPLIYVNTSVIRIFFPLQDSSSHLKEKVEDTLVLKIGSVSMAPQADNPLTRTILRKDIYQRALNLGVLRDPGSEVEDRQYQIDLQSINVGTAQWGQLQPQGEGMKSGTPPEGERSSQNPALEWNMASSIQKHQERRAILTPILTDFSVRITAAPAIIYSKPVTSDNRPMEDIVVCGHSLELNVTSALEMFLSLSQVQLIQQLILSNMVILGTSEKNREKHRQNLHHGNACAAGHVETLKMGSVSCGQDSGFGSDSEHMRFVHYDKHNTTSHRQLTCLSRQPTITKNLSFIPFDIFLTAGSLTLMTYIMTQPSVSTTEPPEHIDEKFLNIPKKDPEHIVPQMPELVTAGDLLSTSSGAEFLMLEGLSSPSREHGRQTLGVTVVRQPGRRGVGGGLLQPLLLLQLTQPSTLLSCHQRRQRLELSLFDLTLKGVASDYAYLDTGKSLPESLDYSVFWLETVAGEADSRTGIPPPLLSLSIRDFLNGPAELKVELCRPLKVNPTPTKLDQVKMWRKIFPDGFNVLGTSSCFPEASDSTKLGDSNAVSPSVSSRIASILQTFGPFHKVSLQTVQMIIMMEIELHPLRPTLTFSVSGMTAILGTKSGQQPVDSAKEVCVLWQCEDVLMQTGLRGSRSAFVGPFSCSLDLEVLWCRHCGSPDNGPPRILLEMRGGLLQVFWGQEHYNCLTLIQEYLQSYLKEVESQVEEIPIPSHLSHSLTSYSDLTEHSSDDLRTGVFRYIQGSDSQKLPGVYEVMFYNETEDSPGVMMWRYPEPRILTFVRISPVPFNTTEDPEISTADLGDVLQVPCSLEFWDELRRAFVPYQEFSLSESNVCELKMPPLTFHTHQSDLVPSDLWRVVVNNTADGADESSESESSSQLPCEQLVSPTALAACMQVDSCFAPWLVPSLCVSLKLAHLELRLCHHLEQLGTVTSEQLRPFLPDRKLPFVQEYAVVSLREPKAFLREWSEGAQLGQELHMYSTLHCYLVDYRNLTLLPLLHPFSLQGHATKKYTHSQQTDLMLHFNVFLEPMLITVGQHIIHTLDTALKAWQQNLKPEVEELIFCHYVVCNDTQETLCFGQVDTDESVVLSSGQSHQYCWRSHKAPQLLHVCIEGWGNWRWSEPFSIDNVGAMLRCIHRKSQIASLIIKIQQLSGVQKQIIICGRQVICSYLSDVIEVQLVQRCVGLEGQVQMRKLQSSVDPGSKLPSYVLEDSEVTGLCVRQKKDQEWSQDIFLEHTHGNNSCVLQVPSTTGSLVSVCCTIITLEPNSHMQQRVVVFSPLFVMRSHLPDAVFVQIEKRSLGQKECQLIQGQGQEQALFNLEPNITHHLTFQASEEGDVSHCAVPISSALIKQIVNKAGPEKGENLNKILEHFYGPRGSDCPSWPYTYKNPDRLESEPVAQWDSPMQVRLCAWRTGLSTLLVELLPWALLTNHSQWDLWLFEAESIVLQIPAGKTIIPPNFQKAFQIGLYWPHTNTVHKSEAMHLLHDLTSPRWTEVGGAEDLSLDEEGYVDADIILGAPPRQKLCQFCVSSTVRYGIQILQIEDKTILVNNTTHTINYRALLSEHPLSALDQPYSPLHTSVWTLGPGSEAGSPSRCAVPCWDVLRESPTEDLASLLPQKRILLSCMVESKQDEKLWSLPVTVRPDFPRQSMAVPIQQNADTPLTTRALVVTYMEHLGINYIAVSEDPCPRMLIHNRCPRALLLKENLREPARVEVFCRRVPSLCSVHHELYYHSSSFPECRQRDALPTVVLSIASDPSSPTATSPTPKWTDDIDINNPGTQVTFLPGFGCLYVTVAYERGTIILTLAPESCDDAVISRHQRVSIQMLSFRVILSEVSVALCDDITSLTGSVELLRLTMSKLLVVLPLPEHTIGDTPTSHGHHVHVLCGSLRVDNQLYSCSSFHFPVLLCQEQLSDTDSWMASRDLVLNPGALEELRQMCFLCVGLTLSSNGYHLEQVSFKLKPARIYLEDTFIYYLKTLFHTYVPVSTVGNKRVLGDPSLIIPVQVYQSMQTLVWPVQLQRLLIEPVILLISIHASLKLYIASDHTPLSFSIFERGPIFTTPRQLIHALTLHYAAGTLFRAGWVVGSLEILGSPASLVRSIGNGVADFFRLPYEGLTRGPGAFVSGVSRGTSSFVRHISKGTLTSITNLATSLARNMDRLSFDEEYYMRQEEWRRQLPETLGHGLRQGLSCLGLSLLGAIAGIVDQPMQTFTRSVEAHSTAASTARGVISGVGKGIVGIFTKPIGGAAEFVSQTGYGILHGAGLWHLPKQLYPPTELKSADGPNSHLKYVWKMMQSVGHQEVHMALCVRMMSSSGQEHAGCLLLSGEVLFIVSVCEDTQQQAFPITEVQCQQDANSPDKLMLTLQQHRVTSNNEGDGVRERLSEQQYRWLMDYVMCVSQYFSPSSLFQSPVVMSAEPAQSITKTYNYCADPAYIQVFICKFNMVKNKALGIGFN